jgi:hypothetical protein
MGMSLGKLAREMGRLVPAAALRQFGQPAALFFHGVEAEPGDPRLQTNHHGAEIFRVMVNSLKADFDVRPLAELDRVLADSKSHARSVFLMSDDGYANSLSVAAEILGGLPWTLFVPTGHIGTGRPNPIFLARLFFYRAPAGIYALPFFPQLVGLGDEESRQAAAASGIDHLRFLAAEQAEKALAVMTAAFAPGQLDALVGHFGCEKFLDWDGVRALKARGVEIGAHGDTHWPMHDGQSAAWLGQQTVGARARIEAEIGPCRFFAYPFGNKNDIGTAAWQAVKAAGFCQAFTTMSGSLAAGGDPFLLPRYGIGLRDTHLASLVPLLAAGNPRLLAWQRQLGAG